MRTRLYAPRKSNLVNTLASLNLWNNSGTSGRGYRFLTVSEGLVLFLDKEDSGGRRTDEPLLQVLINVQAKCLQLLFRKGEDAPKGYFRAGQQIYGAVIGAMWWQRVCILFIKHITELLVDGWHFWVWSLDSHTGRGALQSGGKTMLETVLRGELNLPGGPLNEWVLSLEPG